MKKILYICAAILLSSVCVLACPLGQDCSEVFGHWDEGNYVEVCHNTNKLSLHGESRVQRIYQMSSGTLKAPGVNPATYTDLGLNGAYKFSKGVNEVVGGAIALPFEMDRSTCAYVRIGIASPDTTGNVIFKFEYKYSSLDEDVSSTTPEEVLYTTTTVSGSAYGYFYANNLITCPSSTDKIIQFRITRMGTTDTSASECYVVGISLVYYLNKLGE